MHVLNQTEIDGVPTLWAPVPGPLRATLTFRVGSADETYVTSGVTHLLEHLALFGLSRPGDHLNGFVDQTRTAFQIVGDDQEVRDFLASVTRQLTDLPLHRVADERGILKAEQGLREGGVVDHLMAHRYGAVGYGLTGFAERGAQHISPDYIALWASHFINRDNCALWLTGPPPAGLRLHLPDGVFRPAPDPRVSILPRTPTWFTGPPDTVALSAVVTRTPAASALAEILRGRLVDELRTRQAMAYSPSAGYHRLTGQVSYLLAGTDLVDGRQAAAVPMFLDIMRQLAGDHGAEHGIRAEELAHLTAVRRRHASDPARTLALIDRAAWDQLHGIVPLDGEQLTTLLDSIRPEQVTAAAQEAFASLLALVPPGLGPQAAPWTVMTTAEHPPMYGRIFPSRHGDERRTASMVLAIGGITARFGQDNYRTVPIDATVAVLCWDDGKRVLVERDGHVLTVEPSLWENGRELVQALDATWPAALRIPMGSRPDDEIPRPVPAPAVPDPTPVWGAPRPPASRATFRR